MSCPFDVISIRKMEAQQYTQSSLPRRKIMGDSVYKVIELVGTSSDQWEPAAKNAVKKAGKN